MRQLLAKLRSLVWPARPDPAKSRRIAEVRLVFCGCIAVAIIGTIGTRIVGLAEAHTNLRLAGPRPSRISYARPHFRS